MSGRIVVTPFNLTNLLDFDVQMKDKLKTGFNLAPHQAISVILQADDEAMPSFEQAFWGFCPSWINAAQIQTSHFSIPIEKLKSADYKTFVKQVKQGKKKVSIFHTQKPCLIPVTGFFKWQNLDEANASEETQKASEVLNKKIASQIPPAIAKKFAEQKQEEQKNKQEKNATQQNFTQSKAKKANKIIFAIRRELNHPFYLAGVWTNYTYELDLSTQKTFALINAPAPAGLDLIDSRMPMILDKTSAKDWLACTDLANFKAPAIPMEFYQVGKSVNQPSNNYKEILQPIGERFSTHN